jgi:NTE family protein
VAGFAHAAVLDREVGKVAATGTRVTVLTPGPSDLAAMGANLMDGRRRLEVLETAGFSSRRRLARLPDGRISR